MSRLKLTEIFYSLQGEADTAGIPTAFVRLTGCPLRCQYCDTAYAFHGGEWWELPDDSRARARATARAMSASPAASRWRRRAAWRCCTQLCDAGYRVSLETSGAMASDAVDARVVRVVDVKTPGRAKSPAIATRSCAAHAEGSGEVRDLRPRRLRVERRQAARARSSTRAAGAVLSEPRAAAGARARRLDAGRIACRCASRSSCTSTCGAMCPANRRLRAA